MKNTKENFVYGSVNHYVGDGVDIEVIKLEENKYKISMIPEYRAMDIYGEFEAMVCDVLNSYSFEVLEENNCKCYLVVKILPSVIEEWEFDD